MTYKFNKSTIAKITFKSFSVVLDSLLNLSRWCGERVKNDKFFARQEKMTTFAFGKVIHDQLPLNSPRA